MKKYILIVLSLKNATEVFKMIEEMLESGDIYNTMQVGTMHVITFKTDVSLEEIKVNLENVYRVPPLFFIFDATNRGENFELGFGKLEPTILLENAVIEFAGDTIDVLKEEEGDEKDVYELNELLELVFKNGYETLTDKQREHLKKYSDGEFKD